MKTQRKSIATLTIAGALIFTFSLVNAQIVPDNFRQETNWMEAWKSFSSPQSDATWIMNMSEGETTSYVSDDQEQFILISKRPTDFPMVDESEIIDFAGNNSNCRMVWNGDMHDLDIETIQSGYHGKISGKQFQVVRVDMITFDNTLTTILVFGSVNSQLKVLRDASIAFMDQENQLEYYAEK